MNYAYINNITKLTELAISQEYKITTRATKYLLSIASKDFKFFLDEMMLNNKTTALEELLRMSHANEYNKIELYKKNLEQLSIVIPS